VSSRPVGIIDTFDLCCDSTSLAFTLTRLHGSSMVGITDRLSPK
jgi:hypothetical protein